MSEYDRLCVCGHERRKHAHGRIDDEFLLNGGVCSGKGCDCQRFAERADEPEVVQINALIQRWVGENGALLPPDFLKLLSDLDWIVRNTHGKAQGGDGPRSDVRGRGEGVGR